MENSTTANGLKTFLNICVGTLDNFFPREEELTRKQYVFDE